MSAWPSLDRAADERLARALAVGDPAAPALLTDRYGARLYDYCHALLRDQDDAAWALHNALLAACALGRAGSPDIPSGGRLRGWLYALVRTECLRRLHDPDRPVERIEAPEAEDPYLDEAEQARRLEGRRLAHSALAGLRGRERETLDLLLRHDLDTPEIGAVLGLDDADAARLTADARAAFDDAVAAALIARADGDGCPRAAALAAEGGWPLTPDAARALVRHAEECRRCGGSPRRPVAGARLLQVLPVALMPAELPGAITDAAADPEVVAAAAERAGSPGPEAPTATVRLAGPPSGADGADDLDGPRRRRLPPRLLPALGAAAAVVLVVLGAYLLMPGSSDPAAGLGSPSPSAPADPSDSPEDSPPPSESATPSPTPTTTSPSPTPSTSATTRTATPKPTHTLRKTPSTRPAPPTHGAPPQQSISVSPSSCELPGMCVVNVHAPSSVTWTVVSDGGFNVSQHEGTGEGSVMISGDCHSGSVSFSPQATVAVTCTESQGRPTQ
ncbi:RNA polymerase sigma factor [Actinomadura atramentaria]|uniref:RNA polymerase sigma factor n=1 Tax=Actinomadura atramentaria TaxID=1990 RepID=UPI00039F0006|nr:hypothetical protein [Actinomadura atramentaria]